MILLGLNGKKQVGKDTVYDILKARYSGIVRVAFADELYLEIAQFLRQTDNQFKDWTYERIIIHMKKNKPQYRLLLQWWGTEFRRKQDERYWINKWMHRIINLPDSINAVIVTDVRFLNEAQIILNSSGHLWTIRRANEDAHGVDTHQSECDLDNNKDIKWNAMIDNNGTLAELEEQVVKCFSSLIQQTNNK